MKYDVCILSQDEMYAQWLLLLLSERFTRVTVSESALTAPTSAIYIVDLDSASLPKKEHSITICFSSYSDRLLQHGGLLRPFSPEELYSAIDGADVKGEDGALQEGDRVIIFGSRHIRLTEREYSLYSLLAEAKGKSVDRTTLCQKIWGCEDTESLNIYIYYLRRKLEQNGIKAIKAHRGKGYSLIIRGADHASFY